MKTADAAELHVRATTHSRCSMPEGWIALAAFALLVAVVVPIRLLPCPPTPAASVGVLRHADRQDHVLLRRGGSDESDLGLRRDLEPRARRVLRARRLRVRHVPDAHDRPRRPVPKRSAGLHGVPRLESVSVVLVVHRSLLVFGAAGGAGRPHCSRSCSATSRFVRASRAFTSRSSRRP